MAWQCILLHSIVHALHCEAPLATANLATMEVTPPRQPKPAQRLYALHTNDLFEPGE